MNPKISVIIPIYNAAPFLEKCIKSIINQSLKDIEVILVNDGSIDHSLSICELFSNKDERISIINQTNAGVSSARNAGIEKASGDFIIFTDADDYTDSTMLEELYSKAILENSDIVFCDFYYTKYNIDRIVKINFTKDSHIAIERILTGELQGFMPNKLINRSLYLNNNIRFNPTITMGEDMLVMCQLLLITDKLSYLPKPFFHYVQHKSSAVAQRRMSSFESQKKLVNLFEELLTNHPRRDQSIAMYKVFVKKEMLLFGKYSHKAIIDTYPEVNSEIAKYLSMNIFEKKYFSAVINNSKLLALYRLPHQTVKKIYSTKVAWIIKSYI